MTRGLTKTAILAASLGLVSIVSNAAYAGSDMVIGVCLEDPETRDLRLERLHTNLGAELPAGIEPGVIGCIDAILAFVVGGFELIGPVDPVGTGIKFWVPASLEYSQPIPPAEFPIGVTFLLRCADPPCR